MRMAVKSGGNVMGYWAWSSLDVCRGPSNEGARRLVPGALRAEGHRTGRDNIGSWSYVLALGVEVQCPDTAGNDLAGPFTI